MKKKIIIFDLDGTLANTEHRSHYLLHTPKKWDDYFSAAKDDSLIEKIAEIYRVFQEQEYLIYIMSGRSNATRDDTESWLLGHGLRYEKLWLRRIGDKRADTVVKKNWVKEAKLTPEDVFVVFEDRNKVVSMWRELGFTCLQVAEGDF